MITGTTLLQPYIALAEGSVTDSEQGHWYKDFNQQATANSPYMHAYKPKAQEQRRQNYYTEIYNRENDLSIRTRQNKEFDAPLIRAGNFNIAPTVQAGTSFNDNIFAAPSDEQADFIHVVNPKVSVVSDFSEHMLRADVFAEKAFYQDNEDENYLDYGLTLGGEYDVTGDTSIPVSVGYIHDHIRRSSPDGRTGTEPIQFDVMQAKTGVNHSGQTISFSVIGSYADFIYENTPATIGELDNGDREREEIGGEARIGFTNEAILAPFVYTDMRDISYDKKIDDEGFARSALVYGYGLGTQINVSDALFALVKLGMTHRQVDDARFSDISEPAYGIDFTWEPTALLAITAGGERRIEETTLRGFSASVDSILRLNALYELAPNMMLQPNLGYELKEYEGLTEGEIEQYRGGLTFKYKLNRNIWANTGYQYTDQQAFDSPQLTDFQSNLFFVNLQFQM